MALLILVILNLPVFALLLSLLFGKGDFLDSLRYLFIPEIVSAFRGEYWQDRWAETKLMVLLVLCFTMVWSELAFIKEHFPALYIYFAPLFD